MNTFEPLARKLRIERHDPSDYGRPWVIFDADTRRSLIAKHDWEDAMYWALEEQYPRPIGRVCATYVHTWAKCACGSRDVSEVRLYDTSRLTCRKCGNRWLEQGAGG